MNWCLEISNTQVGNETSTFKGVQIMINLSHYSFYEHVLSSLIARLINVLQNLSLLGRLSLNFLKLSQ